MYRALIQVVIGLLCLLPTLVGAVATTQSIHVEWGYTPPSEPAVTGFKLYQEGAFACQTQDPAATAMDCEVTLSAETTNFTLTATFSDGTESPHSAPFPFTTATDGTTAPPVATEPTGSNLMTFSWDYSGTDATGFRVYQNVVQACETTDPTARQLACELTLPSGTVSYGITAVHSDGSETSLSNLLVYLPDASGTTPEEPPTTGGELKAAITTNTLSGTAPLAVVFDGSTSTGDIATYAWDFGDGSIASGISASHTYATAGSYTARLTVTTSAGLSSSATVTITASQSATTPPPSTPPTAVISSSTAAGPAPLTVSFDGSGSSATNATISSSSWDFGDGTSATGTSASHTYTSAGTFSATLTVTDSNGLTGSASTPVVVTAPISTNKPPTAAISANPLSGTVPLTVSFNGSGSSDSDGWITSYVWNFGDGSSATGANVTHTYLTEASFTATLEVTDNQGAKGATGVTITVQAKEEEPVLNMEMGEISVSDQWVRVSLESTFTNPIVIAGPPSFADGQPCVVRVRNINSTGFDIRLTEWNYLDGTHPAETISYLVMEKGRHTLPDGSSVEAGSFAGTTSFKTIPFSQAFAKVPVVLTTVASMNEADTIAGRIKNVTAASFAYYFREQEKNKNTHANETVHFIAWEPGKGTVGPLHYEAAKTAHAVTQAWYSAALQDAFTAMPLLLADMQTTANTDTSALRVQQISASGFQVKVEEEQSKDSEVTHPAETVGYLAISQAERKALATFTWEFDSAQEATITGFEIQANSETICTSSDPTARKLSCEISQPTSQTTFTVRAVETTGATSSASNSLTYTP